MDRHFDTSPAPLPVRRSLEGRLVAIVPLDPLAHASALYEGSHGDGEDRLWRYMADGPYGSRAEFLALGYAAYLRMTPAHRVIEVGGILYTRNFQRTAGATEAM